MSRLVNGACPLDCPDTCAWQVEVEDGRALRLRARKDHPFTRGALCGKVNRYLDAVDAPTRLTTPLRRVGPKGEGAFQAIDWDEAIGLAAEGIRDAIDRDGPEAVMPYYYAGTLGHVQGWSLGQRLFNHLGSTRMLGTICTAAASAAMRATTGRPLGPDPEDLEHANLVLIWGTNLLTANMHQWHFAHAAQERGAHLVCIDPLPTDTALRCDEHLQLLPGTDGALAMGLMRVVLDRGRADEEWLLAHAEGWPDLRNRLEQWTVERAAAICGLDTSIIEALGTRIAETRPTAIRIGLGLQRHGGAGSAVRAILALSAIAGDYRHVGGGGLCMTAGRFDHVTRDLEEPADLPMPPGRVINMSRLAEALTDPALDPPIRSLVVWDTNPAATVPDQLRARRGLLRDDLHLTVLEQRMTDTALLADVVLPATMQVEHLDIHASYGHHYLALNLPAVAPPDGCLTNTEIFRRLAHALGLDHPRLHDSDEDLARQFIDTDAARARGITFESLSETGFARVDDIRGTAPHAEGGFATPSGRLRIVCPELAEEGLAPVPDYLPPAEGADPVLAERFPLQLITPATRFFLNSTFNDLEGHRRKAGGPCVYLSPTDAAARGIGDGDVVVVRNDRGAFTAPAAVHPLARSGVAWAYKVHATDGIRGVNVNATTAVRDADMGGSPTFHDNRVEIALADAAESAAAEAHATAVGD
ncbi:MAG: molybdopterin-containing oxidoreductase family protein [Gaiellales bacterium]